MVKSTLKIKINKLRYHSRNAFLRRALLTTLALSKGSTLGIASEIPNPSNNATSTETTTGYKRFVNIDVEKEVEKRADWFIDAFLSSSERHFAGIKSASASGRKESYVKRNFFDVVYPGLSGSNHYCIAAINRFLIDANQHGDLDGVLPSNQNRKQFGGRMVPEGNWAVECNRFKDFLIEKGFEDCISYGRVDFSTIQPGDIVLQPRNSNNYHATTYIGNGRIRSFNKDYEGDLRQNPHTIVIHTKQIFEKNMLQQLENQGLIQKEGNRYGNIIPLDNAQKLIERLYIGRDASLAYSGLEGNVPKNTLDISSYFVSQKNTPRS